MATSDKNELQSATADVLPTVVTSHLAYEGLIVRVRRDEIQFPGGPPATREVVETTNAVAIVAMDARCHVCLIRQYRHPQGGWIWEIPAGRLDVVGEDPMAAAKRELLEETGLAADTWTLLTMAISSAGFATERTHIFLATDTHPAPVPADFRPEMEEERIEKAFRPIDDLVSDIKDGTLGDAKTVIGVLLASAKMR